MQVHCIALLALVPASLGSIFPVASSLSNVVEVATLAGQVGKVGNELNATPRLAVDTRRRGKGRKKPRRSTSSSSGERVMSGQVKDSGDSLGLQSSDSDSSSEKDKNNDVDGRGWRKWHRQCTPCPVDMAKKWRDPTIKWVCGGYQRARRTFKSECMMYYRNCQDGTMFVKIHDYRCDDTVPGYNGGRHFFYDYKVKLPDDTSGKSSSSETDNSQSSSSFVSKSSE